MVILAVGGIYYLAVHVCGIEVPEPVRLPELPYFLRDMHIACEVHHIRGQIIEIFNPAVRAYLQVAHILAPSDMVFDFLSVRRCGPRQIYRLQVIRDLHAFLPFVIRRGPDDFRPEKKVEQFRVELRVLDFLAGGSCKISYAELRLLPVKRKMIGVQQIVQIIIRKVYLQRNLEKSVVMDILRTDYYLPRRIAVGIDSVCVREKRAYVQPPEDVHALVLIQVIVLIGIYHIPGRIQMAAGERRRILVPDLPVDVPVMVADAAVRGVLVGEIIYPFPCKARKAQKPLLPDEETLVQAQSVIFGHRYVRAGDYDGACLDVPGHQPQRQRNAHSGDETRRVRDGKGETPVGILNLYPQLPQPGALRFVRRFMACRPEVAGPCKFGQVPGLMVRSRQDGGSYDVGASVSGGDVQVERAGAVLPHIDFLAFRQRASQVAGKEESPGVGEILIIEFPVRLEHRLGIEAERHPDLPVAPYVEIIRGVAPEEEPVEDVPLKALVPRIQPALELQIGQKLADTFAAGGFYTLNVLLGRVCIARHEHTLPVLGDIEHELFGQPVLHGDFMVAHADDIPDIGRPGAFLGERTQHAVRLSYVHAFIDERLQVRAGNPAVVDSQHDLGEQPLHFHIHGCVLQWVKGLPAPA